MCRRLRRLRRFAHQVVEVTRRIWRVCRCCGAVQEETQRDIVPLSAVIAGSKAMRSPQINQDDMSSAKCCHVSVHACTDSRKEKTQESCRRQDILNLKTVDVDVLKVDGSYQEQLLTPSLPLNNQAKCNASALEWKTSAGNENAANRRSGTYETKSRPYYIEVASHSPRNLSPTDDTVKVNFPKKPHLSPKLFSQTSNEILENKVSTSRSSSTVCGTLSGSSQTDDHVAMRFYRESLFPLTQTTVQGSFDRANHINPVDHSGSPYHLHQRCNSDTSQTDDDVAMRFYTTSPIHGTFKDDTSPSQLVTSRHTSPQEVALSLRLPLSGIPLSPVTRPADLKLEYAVAKMWHNIYPVEWTIKQNMARNRDASVDLAVLGEHNTEIALKTMNAAQGRKETKILIDCQCPFVVKLCACFVQREKRYLCMSYYDRRDLAKWLTKDTDRKYFRQREAIWINAFLLAALEFIHDKGILHMDVKPGNILIDNSGYPVLGDFGSALRTRELKSVFGVKAFTPAYASPEVHSAGRPDKMDDLWSAACIFYEITAGHLPYRGRNNDKSGLKIFLGNAPDVSMVASEAKDFICAQLKPWRSDRLGYTGGSRDVMRHRIFRHVNWDYVKYDKRLERCHLIEVFNRMDRDEREARNKPDPIPPNPFGCRNNNSCELGSSASGEEGDCVSAADAGIWSCVKEEEKDAGHGFSNG